MAYRDEPGVVPAVSRQFWACPKLPGSTGSHRDHRVAPGWKMLTVTVPWWHRGIAGEHRESSYCYRELPWWTVSNILTLERLICLVLDEIVELGP